MQVVISWSSRASQIFIAGPKGQQKIEELEVLEYQLHCELRTAPIML